MNVLGFNIIRNPQVNIILGKIAVAAIAVTAGLSVVGFAG